MMYRRPPSLVLALWLLAVATLASACGGSQPTAPDTTTSNGSVLNPREVVFPSGGLDLHGYLWEPSGRGPFPAVLYNHGSEKLPGSKPVLGAYFNAQGFVFFVPHRRGQGLSPGPYISDVVAATPAAQQNQVVVDQLVAQVEDVSAGLTYLLGLPEVDRSRIVVAGCSYGGIETVLASERDLPLRAGVDFAGAAESWAGNPILQTRLMTAVDGAREPIFFLQAMNDYNTAPSLVLSGEMAKLGKPYQVKIYPPYGTTADDGHSGFCTNAPDVWGGDVLAFMRSYIP
jgi:dipeptidyl aminopeptidase/acylaminoacyl peptidase